MKSCPNRRHFPSSPSTVTISFLFPRRADGHAADVIALAPSNVNGGACPEVAEAFPGRDTFTRLAFVVPDSCFDIGVDFDLHCLPISPDDQMSVAEGLKRPAQRLPTSSSAFLAPLLPIFFLILPILGRESATAKGQTNKSRH
jgi:hypothetical protein